MKKLLIIEAYNPDMELDDQGIDRDEVADAEMIVGVDQAGDCHIIKSRDGDWEARSHLV